MILSLFTIISQKYISTENEQRGNLTSLRGDAKSVRLAKVVELAEEFDIYAYDGYVLDCARQYRTPLLSLDKNMIDIAKQLQIPIMEVSL